MGAHTIEIAEGLIALCNTYEVDGQVSWHSPAVRGFATANCYLLQEDRDALLIDTGLTVHGAALERQLRDALDGDANLSILVLRQGEFDSVCNLLPLVDRFGVRTVYGQFDDILRWADFRNDFDVSDGWVPAGGEVSSVRLSREATLTLGRDAGRRLHVFRPLLRLLSTHWIYDEAHRTLFTSDSFSYVVRPAESGPWRLTAENDDVTVEHIRDHLVNTRYWWLAESDVEEVRRDLSTVFDRHDVEHIAPAFGAVISGRAVVARHVALLDESIAQLGHPAAARV
jgi:flavorubredoxin